MVNVGKASKCTKIGVMYEGDWHLCHPCHLCRPCHHDMEGGGAGHRKVCRGTCRDMGKLLLKCTIALHRKNYDKWLYVYQTSCKRSRKKCNGAQSRCSHANTTQLTTSTRPSSAIVCSINQCSYLQRANKANQRKALGMVTCRTITITMHNWQFVSKEILRGCGFTPPCWEYQAELDHTTHKHAKRTTHACVVYLAQCKWRLCCSASIVSVAGLAVT